MGRILKIIWAMISIISLSIITSISHNAFIDRFYVSMGVLL